MAREDLRAVPAEKRDRQFSIRLTQTEDEALTIVAKELKLSETDAIRKLITMAAGNLRKVV